MAGDPIYDCCDNYTNACSSSCVTLTINSTTDTYYVNHYVEKSVPKKSKKEMIKERAEQLHKLSFLMVNEVRPKVFQVIGYPTKSKPKPYHKNYALH